MKYIAKVRIIGDDGVERTYIVSDINATTDAQAYARLNDLKAEDGKRNGKSRVEALRGYAIDLILPMR